MSPEEIKKVREQYQRWSDDRLGWNDKHEDCIALADLLPKALDEIERLLQRQDQTLVIEKYGFDKEKDYYIGIEDHIRLVDENKRLEIGINAATLRLNEADNFNITLREENEKLRAVVEAVKNLRFPIDFGRPRELMIDDLNRALDELDK